MKYRQSPSIFKIALPRGFTLIEMMVVIAILAIIVSVAAPSFKQMIATQQVSSLASNLQMSLMKARSAAITKGMTSTLSAASGGWADGWSVTIENAGVKETIDAAGKASASVNVTGATSLTYSANGRPGGTVAISIESKTETSVARCVRLDATGRPSVEKNKC